MDKETRRGIILDNYEHPFHKGLTSDETFIKKSTQSESCIDHIEMMMKLEDDIIKDVYFDGEACSICTSATSILLSLIIGKSISEANEIIDNYNKMINEEDYDESVIKELIVYSDLYLQPNRKKCALLPAITATKIIKEGINHDS